MDVRGWTCVDVYVGEVREVRGIMVSGACGGVRRAAMVGGPSWDRNEAVDWTRVDSSREQRAESRERPAASSQRQLEMEFNASINQLINPSRQEDAGRWGAVSDMLFFSGAVLRAASCELRAEEGGAAGKGGLGGGKEGPRAHREYW